MIDRPSIRASVNGNLVLNGAEHGTGVFLNYEGLGAGHVRIHGGRPDLEIARFTPLGLSINTTISSGGLRLIVNGQAAKPGGGSWAVFSDERLKHSIVPIASEGGMLDRLLSLKGYTFEFHEEAIEDFLALPGRQIGLIAQDVAEVFPDWVDENDEGYLFVTERGLTAIIVEALREMRAEKDAEIDALHRRIANLEAIVEQLADFAAAGGAQ